MIIAQLATIPERRNILNRVVDSLYNQVDVLFVILNGYKEYPNFVKLDKKLVYYLGDNSKGDCHKFDTLEHYKDAYIFTCDDDLVYPPDYVETMVNHIDRYNRKVIITLHGRTFPPRPIKSYYRGKLKGYHWDTDQDYDVEVDAGGTGVMCWHSDTFHVPYDRITYGNMGDVWVAKFAREQNVKIINVARKSGWVDYIGPEESDTDPQTLWSKHHNNDPIQTYIYNGC